MLKNIHTPRHDYNPANQILADELKKPTPVRKLGNVISVLTAMGMIGYTLSRHSQRSQ